MLYFPQLASGAVSQFPIRKRWQRRTVVNRLLDGRAVKLADPDGSTVEWRLELEGLGEEERSRIESLFAEAEGRLKSFVFLDPTDNLLTWSEDLAQAAWVRGAGLELTANVADPAGTSRAARITNGTGAALTVQQTLSVPGSLEYCLSMYARSEQPGEVWLFRSTARKRSPTGPAWRRIVHPTKLEDTSETVSFGLELGAGRSVEVFGLQVEAQPGASKYKKTTSRSGVYAEAFFQDDVLSVTTKGPGQHGCVVRIRARV
jgi:hypothetical protein